MIALPPELLGAAQFKVIDCFAVSVDLDPGTSGDVTKVTFCAAETASLPSVGSAATVTEYVVPPSNPPVKVPV